MSARAQSVFSYARQQRFLLRASSQSTFRKVVVVVVVVGFCGQPRVKSWKKISKKFSNLFFERKNIVRICFSTVF